MVQSYKASPDPLLLTELYEAATYLFLKQDLVSALPDAELQALVTALGVLSLDQLCQASGTDSYSTARYTMKYLQLLTIAAKSTPGVSAYLEHHQEEMRIFLTMIFERMVRAENGDLLGEFAKGLAVLKESAPFKNKELIEEMLGKIPMLQGLLSRVVQTRLAIEEAKKE
jgi:hypothetical protein